MLVLEMNVVFVSAMVLLMVTYSLLLFCATFYFGGRTSRRAPGQAWNYDASSYASALRRFEEIRDLQRKAVDGSA